MKTMLGELWRRLPAPVRRAGVWLAEARFGVTVGAVVIDDAGRVLLLEHRFRAGNGWGIPGGFINRNEQPEDALRRELQEEIGLEVTDVRLAFVRTLSHTQRVEIIFRCAPHPATARATPRSVEIKSLGWFDSAAPPANLHPAQLRLVHRALEATNH